MIQYRHKGSTLSVVLAMMILLTGFLFAQEEPAEATAVQEDTRIEGPELEAGKRYYAAMTTSLGLVVIELFPEVAPKTVRNFVNLSEGTRPWRNPRNNRNAKTPYYDGLSFHRVIKGFMIQGGCPLGNGSGGPGYRFEDEVNPEVTFTNKDYLLAMANSGPNTNGSQFFITDGGSNPQHLNMRHTIFGEVVEGKDVVDAIASVEKNQSDVPTTPVIIRHVQVIRVPADAAADAWKSELLAIPTDAPFDPAVEYKKATAAVEAAVEEAVEAVEAVVPEVTTPTTE
jgi:peptidyl-prolyl cis-trans isomerase A (cyclophilin A)